MAYRGAVRRLCRGELPQMDLVAVQRIRIFLGDGSGIGCVPVSSQVATGRVHYLCFSACDLADFIPRQLARDLVDSAGRRACIDQLL